MTAGYQQAGRPFPCLKTSREQILRFRDVLILDRQMRHAFGCLRVVRAGRSGDGGAQNFLALRLDLLELGGRKDPSKDNLFTLDADPVTPAICRKLSHNRTEPMLLGRASTHEQHKWLHGAVLKAS